MARFKSLGANAVWFPSGRPRPTDIPKSRGYSRRFVFLSRVCPEKGIDINDIEEFDLEVLIASKVSEMNSSLKGFAAGSIFMMLLGVF